MSNVAPTDNGGGGQTLSPAEIIALWLQAGGSITSAPMALARALSESSGRTAVTSSNPDGGTNVGLWQLDTPGGVGSGYSVAQLQDPLTNARITVKATNNGQNWSQWADNYQQFLSQSQAAVSSFQNQAASNPGGLDGLAKGILSGVEGALSGAVGSSAANAISGQLLQLPSQVTGFFAALEQPLQKLLWIVNPTSWARIVAAVFGFMLLAGGLVTLGLAA